MATRWWVRIAWKLGKVFLLKVDPHMIALFRKVNDSAFLINYLVFFHFLPKSGLNVLSKL